MKIVLLSKLISFSYISNKLQDIEKGIHDDNGCETYCKYYKREFGQELPDCEYKGNKSKIQKLIRKVHIDEDGSETEIQFDYKKNDEELNVLERKIKTKRGSSMNLGTKLKNIFRRK